MGAGELDDDDLAQVYERFHEAHSQLYGYARRDSRMEIVNLRLTALARMPRPRLEASQNGRRAGSPAEAATRAVYFHGIPWRPAYTIGTNWRPATWWTGPRSSSS